MVMVLKSNTTAATLKLYIFIISSRGRKVEKSGQFIEMHEKRSQFIFDFIKYFPIGLIFSINSFKSTLYNMSFVNDDVTLSDRRWLPAIMHINWMSVLTTERPPKDFGSEFSQC